MVFFNRLFCIDRDSGNTPLHLASRKGHAEIVNALIAGGAEVNIPNAFGIP